MGLVFRPNLRRNSEAEGVGGIENVIEDRLRRVQLNPSKQREIASLRITNSIFAAGRLGPPDFRQTCAYDARENGEKSPVSPFFRVPRLLSNI